MINHPTGKKLQHHGIASPGKLLCAGISAERAVITQSSRQLVGLSYFLTSPQQQQRTLVLGHLTHVISERPAPLKMSAAADQAYFLTLVQRAEITPSGEGPS